MQKNWKGLFGVPRSLCLLLVIAVLLLPKAALGAVTPVGFEQEADTRSGIVRVCLASLEDATTLDIQLSAAYRVYNTELALPANENITIGLEANTGNVTLAYAGQRWNVGPEAILLRSSKQAAVTIRQATDANAYPADLAVSGIITEKGYVLRLVAYIQVEDYLTGVLSHAILDTAHSEALKAQAVVARTYTLRAMELHAEDAYDVVDTGADQLYRGTGNTNAACKAAVSATAGTVLKYEGELIEAWHTFSNGGQTESVRNAWGEEDCAYLIVQDDPFDLASRSAIAKTVQIDKDLQNGTVPEALSVLLKQKAIETLAAEGYSANDDNTSLLWLESVKLRNPRFAPPSKLYTAADFAMMAQTGTADGGRQVVSVTVNAQIFDELEKPLDMSLQPNNNELWSVSAKGNTITLRAARFGHGVGMSQYGAVEMAEQGYACDYILGFYYPGCTCVKLNLSAALLREVLEASKVSGPTLRPITTPRPTDTEPVPESPIPAEPEATEVPAEPEATEVPAEPEATEVPAEPEATEVPAEPEITEVPVEPEITEVPAEPEATEVPAEPEATEVPAEPEATEVPAEPEATEVPAEPEITEVPAEPEATEAPAEPEATAVVSATQPGYAYVIANNFLNLREAPSKQAPILTIALEGEWVELLEEQNGWAKISYNGITAYAVRGLLSEAQAEPAQPVAAADHPQPAATPEATAEAVSATVYARSGSVNFRQQPSMDGAIMLRLVPGTPVMVYGTEGDFSIAEYMGKHGYIMTEFLRFGDEEPVPAPTVGLTPVPTAEPTPEPTATPAPTVQTTTPLAPEQQTYEYRNARVTTSGGSLNLREMPSDGSAILERIPQCSVVLALELDDIWCSVRYNGITGYAKKSFLTFGENYATEIINGQMSILLPEYTMGSATVVTPSGSLNLRQKPCPYSAVLSLIPNRSKVEVYSIEAGWALVTYREYAGYVSVDYLEMQQPVTEARSSAEESFTVLPDGFEPVQGFTAVTNNSASLRLTPEADGTVLAEVAADTELPVLAAGAEWCIVAWENQTGYLAKSDAELRND